MDDNWVRSLSPLVTLLHVFIAKNEKVGHLVVLSHPLSTTNQVTLRVTRGDNLRPQLSPLKYLYLIKISTKGDK